jgi:hypothetical protein
MHHAEDSINTSPRRRMDLGPAQAPECFRDSDVCFFAVVKLNIHSRCCGKIHSVFLVLVTRAQVDVGQ